MGGVIQLLTDTYLENYKNNLLRTSKVVIDTVSVSSVSFTDESRIQDYTGKCTATISTKINTFKYTIKNISVGGVENSSSYLESESIVITTVVTVPARSTYPSIIDPGGTFNTSIPNLAQKNLYYPDNITFSLDTKDSSGVQPNYNKDDLYFFINGKDLSCATLFSTRTLTSNYGATITITARYTK